MEIHSHSHTPRKKVLHYFWEFLMLFLAVVCGFLAENQREHVVEHQREKVFMRTLIEDLKIDTANMGSLKRTLDGVRARKDSIVRYLRPPIDDNSLLQYYRESGLILNMRSYTYNDRTVDQLRNSGNYRLIRHTNITDSLIAYDIRMRGTFSSNYNSLYQSRIKLIDLQTYIIEPVLLFDYGDKNRILNVDSLKNNDRWPLKLFTKDQNTLFHYYNSCITHIGFAMDMNSWIIRMTDKAINLIKLIQKEYHF